MPIAQVNGQRLYYEDTGGTGPAVIFSHGLFMDHEMFAPQVAALRRRYRCITWDERGHGDAHEEHRQRWQQPPRPPHPELPQRDGARAMPLGDEERADQVAADDEEHVDAEEAGWHPPHVGVIQHHRGDGQRPHPVDAGVVWKRARRGPAVGDQTMLAESRGRRILCELSDANHRRTG